MIDFQNILIRIIHCKLLLQRGVIGVLNFDKGNLDNFNKTVINIFGNGMVKMIFWKNIIKVEVDIDMGIEG